MRYAVVIEKGETSYGAYVPDLPGCVAVAESLEDVRHLIRRRSHLILKDYKRMLFLFPNLSLFANMLKLKLNTNSFLFPLRFSPA